MSVEINTIILGGNLTRDVLVKDTSTGRKVASFTVASNRTFVSNGEKKKETAFVDVDVWGKIAENCGQYLRKGSPVVVTGRLKQDQWVTETGDKRSKLKIIATNVQFLSTGNRSAEPIPGADPDAGAGWDGS